MKKSTLKFVLLTTLTLFAGASFFIPPVKKDPLIQKNNRFLLMLSSFKRPIFLSGQIYRLLNQNYPYFDISVSIKGSPNDYGFSSTFSREFEQFEKTGKVFVRFDHNRGQFANLLDTIRHINIDNYDYFCKIDDDDWYSHDYLFEVNRNLNKIPVDKQKISSSTYHNGYILTENIDTTKLNINQTPLTGPTLCFSREIMRIALRIEKEPALIDKYLPGESANLFERREDRFLDHMARKNGMHIERESLYPTVIYGWQYRSVIRNNGYVR